MSNPTVMSRLPLPDVSGNLWLSVSYWRSPSWRDAGVMQVSETRILTKRSCVSSLKQLKNGLALAIRTRRASLITIKHQEKPSAFIGISAARLVLPLCFD